MLRAAHLLMLCIALGLVALRVSLPGSLPRQSGDRRVRAAGMALVLSQGAAALLLVAHGRMLLPDERLIRAVGAACSTWIGQVIAVQCLLAVAALACLRHHRLYPLALALVLVAAGASAFRGHVIAASDAGFTGLAAVVHVTLATLWLGGLAALLACRRLDGSGGAAMGWRAALQVFSRWALPGMLLLLASGVLVAVRTVGSGAALLATPYGGLLLAKLVVIAAALLCALQLRRWLASLTVMSAAQAGRWLSAESVLAIAILGLAGWVATMVPAAHDQIHWPWSFRIAPMAAWRQKGGDLLWPLVSAVILLASMCYAVWRRRRRPPRLAVGTAILGMAAALPLAIHALSVDAYPTTYLHSPIPYDAPSVAAGARLYRQWCVGCHGEHGRGDGALRARLSVQPANLTEPHVQWHTHGDLYWWITAGIARAGMPGFRDRLSDDERWQLLNFLAALSLGYEARPMSAKIAVRDPWLPAIDFRYPSTSGEFDSLSEWRRRERAVLLAFVGTAAQLERLATWDALASHREHAGVVVPIIVMQAQAERMVAPAGWQPVVDATGAIGSAWSHYRRTLDDPDFNNERTGTGGLLFLIDRFGFVRARWTVADPLPAAAELNELATSLNREPELRSADIHAAR